MKIKIKDSFGKPLQIGDTVEILKVTDDSGNATDLFGVEPQLNGWVEQVYIEPFEGVITWDEDKLMVDVRGKYMTLPLSKTIREHLYRDHIEHRIAKEDIEHIVKDFKLDGTSESISDYIRKVEPPKCKHINEDGSTAWKDSSHWVPIMGTYIDYDGDEQESDEGYTEYEDTCQLCHESWKR